MKPKTHRVDKSDQCIKCGICIDYCPVARVTGSFLGPKQAGPDAQRFRRPGDASVDRWVNLCIGCGMCDLICPFGVNVSELNLMAKAKSQNEKRFNLKNWLMGHAYLFGYPAALHNKILANPVFKRASEWFLGIDGRRTIPAYEKETFRQWFKSHRFAGDRKVAYFYGCYTNTHEVDVGIASVHVLNKNGFEVLLSDQDCCCGMLALAQGDIESARALAEKTIWSLKKIVEAGYDVVFSSPTCGHMIRCIYPKFFNVEGVDHVAGRLFDVCEYLMMLYEDGELNMDFTSIEKRLPYHQPCHVRSMGIGSPSLDLLNLIPGLNVQDVDAGCCGLGGTYGFKKETYDISMAIGQDLARALKEFGSPVVVSDCEGCRIQIEHLTGLKAVHPIQILRDAY